MTSDESSRRIFLSTLAAGGLTALAGCSFGESSDTTPTSTTTMTATTPQTTADETEQAVVTGRKAVAGAWSRLWAHRPMGSGRFVLETAVVKNFDKSEITASIALARANLGSARQELNADERPWINALLAFGDYIEYKATAYQQLFTAHLEFGVAVTAYGQNLLYEAIAKAHQAEIAIADSSIALSRAEKGLRTIAELDQRGTVRLMETFETFNLESEDIEFALCDSFIAEYSPAISATQRYLQGMQYLDAGSTAHADEQYQKAIEIFGNAHEQFVSAEDYSSTALNRGVRYRKQVVSFINWLGPVLRQTATLYKDSAIAAQRGDMARASSLRARGTENYRTALQEYRPSTQEP